MNPYLGAIFGLNLISVNFYGACLNETVFVYISSFETLCNVHDDKLDSL